MEDIKSRGPFIYSVLDSAQAFLAQHPFQEPEETLTDGKGLRTFTLCFCCSEPDSKSRRLFILYPSFKCATFFPPFWAEVSPRRRILNVSRTVWKQANVASDLWEKLTARCVDRHRSELTRLRRLTLTQPRRFSPTIQDSGWS